MFASRYRRIYNYHLRKCGGTSINTWLESVVADTLVWQPSWVETSARVFLNEAPLHDPSAFAREFTARGRSVFFWSETVSSHVPLRGFAPPGTFSFTVLRDPVDRIVSQVADWRRLDVAAFPALPAEVAAGIRDARALSLRQFLERHGRTTFPFVFDNYMTRALAAARLGADVLTEPSVGRLAATAEWALIDDFDLIGLTERLAETTARIARRLGLTAPADLQLNATGSRVTLAAERAEADDVLADLSRFDAPLYARAVERFDRDRDQEEAPPAVHRLVPQPWQGHTVFSVRDPIIGSGFHPRDAAGSPACRLWTGPGTRLQLVMPVPQGAPLAVKVWVHGYADERLRDQLSMTVDGKPAAHRFEAVDGWREALVVQAVPTRPWLTLGLETAETVAGPASEPHADPRRRGVSFDRYGWLCLG